MRLNTTIKTNRWETKGKLTMLFCTGIVHYNDICQQLGRCPHQYRIYRSQKYDQVLVMKTEDNTGSGQVCWPSSVFTPEIKQKVTLANQICLFAQYTLATIYLNATWCKRKNVILIFSISRYIHTASWFAISSKRKMCGPKFLEPTNSIRVLKSHVRYIDCNLDFSRLGNHSDFIHTSHLSSAADKTIRPQSTLQSVHRLLLRNAKLFATVDDKLATITRATCQKIVGVSNLYSKFQDRGKHEHEVG